MMQALEPIPKIIHYCWFGGNPLPDLAVKCIESWKKYFPDYEIKEWNESNFDLDCCDYVREAYQAKKWAFVSDYARFWILYHEGGLYFDTDVEVIRPFDDILQNGAFMGCELAERSLGLGANPGLGLGVAPGLGLYREMLDFYYIRHFLKDDGDIDTTTVVDYTTKLLLAHGWKPGADIQKVAGVTIYPPEYFCPMNYETGKITLTEHTYSIHHYHASWLSETEKKIAQIDRDCVNRFGQNAGRKIGRVCDFPFRVKNKVERLGVKGTIQFSLKKLKGK